MMRRLMRNILSSRLAREERGGLTIIILLGFMVLAVPVAIGSTQTAAQLARSSQAYDQRLSGMYAASAGIEAALWEVVSDPSFDDDLTQVSPSKDITVESNGYTVAVTVTKVFTDEDLQGQGIVVTKDVTPTSTAVGVPTTFTYTLTIRNEGTEAVEVSKIFDYLPPGFTYVAASTSGLTTLEPTIASDAPATCGSVPGRLEGRLNGQGISAGSGQELTLTFQATATLSDGTYYNQAVVQYDPWWIGNDVNVYTPYTSEITVGTGTSKCGYNLQVLVTQEVDPETPPVGVPTEFTYTITVENVSASNIYVCKVEDQLPPTFTYVSGSSGEYPSNIITAEPQLSWETERERWNLRWADGPDDNDLLPLDSISAGGTKSQVFRASTTPVAGADYFNEINVIWSTGLTGEGKCDTDPGASGTSYSGAGNASYVNPPTLYDIQAIAPDGTIQSRVVFYQTDGQIDIISWQEY